MLVQFWGQPANTQEVTLKSADGTISLSGKILMFDGEFYRLDTQYGEITLNALGVTCSGPGCPDPAQYAADITVSGTPGAIKDLLPGLIEDFAFDNGLAPLRQDHSEDEWTYFIADPARIPVARIQALAKPSSLAFKDIANKASDLIVTARLPTAAETKAASKNGIGDLSNRYRQQVLALDALVFLVSPENPVEALTRDQLRGVFSGQITNWAALGGVDAPISVYLQAPTTDIAQAFYTAIFPNGQQNKPANTRVFKTGRALSSAVMADPLAIGFSRFSDVRNTKALAIRGACGIVQRPSVFALKTGDYPLTRIVYLFTPARRLPVFARNFLAYLRSEPAQKSIANLGFVGLGMMPKPLAQQQDRLSNAIISAGSDVSLENLQGVIKSFAGASRLATTFRFNDNSTEIDAHSIRNIQTLALMLETGEFDGRTLIFAGFSDAEGGAAGNRRISRSRAEEVAAMVRSYASRADLSRVSFRKIGFGEVSPLACNDTPEGRHMNRRVEVWVK